MMLTCAQTSKYKHPFAHFLGFLYDNSTSYTVLDDMMWAGTAMKVFQSLSLISFFSFFFFFLFFSFEHKFSFSDKRIPQRNSSSSSNLNWFDVVIFFFFFYIWDLRRDIFPSFFVFLFSSSSFFSYFFLQKDRICSEI